MTREKFVIKDSAQAIGDIDSDTEIALSNRLVVPLYDDSGKLSEQFVVRGQNMQGVLRMASRIVRSFAQSGPLTERAISYDWEDAWLGVVDNYDKKYNSNNWIAVYQRGRIIFSQGYHHPFCDIIEKCDTHSKGDYEATIAMARSAFKQAGKSINIDHSATVAMVANASATACRIGLIHRSPSNTSTFNFRANSPEDRSSDLSLFQCLNAAAAFLEGFQVSYFIGTVRERIKSGLIESFDDDGRQMEDATRRLGPLNAEINNFEGNYKVLYRPEKPDFTELQDIASVFTRQQIEKERAEAEDGDVSYLQI